jgi:hypothetical protein
MSGIAPLLACAGEWSGTNRLHDPHTGRPEDSPSSLTVTPVCAGRFVRLDYTWGYQGAPQEGSLLIGHPEGKGYTAHWVDTWHMGDQALASSGAAEPGGGISVMGFYAAPPDPDWGWRTVITPGEKLTVVMFNVTPDGAEEVAVEAEYRRA